MDESDSSNLTAKQRIELFQSSMDQLVQDNGLDSVRQMLHERYLKAKAEQEAKEKAENEAKASEDKPTEKRPSTGKIRGKQFAQVFRFGTVNQLRQRRPPRNQPARRDEENDPLLNDPNVLFQNFAFDNDNGADIPPENLPFFPENQTSIEEDEEEDDSFQSLLSSWFRNVSWFHVFLFIFAAVVYVGGQKIANDYDFGGPFFIVATLAFLFINLRRKTPGELSAYSVFNPDCRPIPTVASGDQPREQILLGFGPL